MVFKELYKRRLTIELNQSDTSVLFTSTRRQEAANDGMREFASLTDCFKRRVAVAVSCGTTEYVLSTISDFSRLSEEGYVEYWFTDSNAATTIQAGSDFVRRDELWLNRYEPGWRQGQSYVQYPTGYYIHDDGGHTVIGVNGLPDVGSSETAALVVPYVARPEPMTSTDAVPFTYGSHVRHDLTEYHPAIVHFAAYRLLPLIGDYHEADRQHAKFMSYVDRYKDNRRRKGGTHVTVARNYYGQSQRRGRDSDLALDRSEQWRWR